MVVVISKEDIPPTSKTKQALDRIQEHANERFREAIDEWWEKVRDLAKTLCRDMGVWDTGTLHDTIRIISGGTELGIGYGGYYEVVVSPTDIQVDRMLIAGGMLINPKTGRICDYAEAVHDGHFTKSGTYVAGRPFLSMALDLAEPELRLILNKFMDEQEKEWMRD